MVKINRNFTIELDVYEEARRANINMSEACERGLADALDRHIHNKKALKEGPKYTPRMERLLKVISPDHRAGCSKKIKESRGHAPGWARVFKRNYGIMVLPTEIIEVFG